MTMFELRSFAKDAVKQVKKYLPEEYQSVKCEITESGKNNGRVRIGIVFHTPDHKASPVVYMEPYYEEICQGKTMSSVLKEIAKDAAEAMPEQTVLDSFDILSYDSVKGYLRLELVNTKANQVLFLDHPHVEVEDLSVLCRIEVPQVKKDMNASKKVTNGLLAKWGIGKEEMFRQAGENTIRMHPPILNDLEEALGPLGFNLAPDMLDNLLMEPELPDKDFFPMYVLSNKEHKYGAVAMLYPEVLERMCGLFPEGYYILPSSTEELIIMPKRTEASPKELGEMVRDINKKFVEKELYLSDRIYEYDKERGRVFQVPESMKKEKEAER